MVSRLIDRAEAVRLLPDAARILVIGCSGSGKSTLARALGERFRLQYISMDRDVFWLPGWQQRLRDDADRRIAELVALPRWVMDGTSPRTLPERLARADLVIWLRPPRYVSLYGVVTRWFRYAGRTRPEMAEGCPERLTLEFLRYVWHFERDSAPKIIERLAAYEGEFPLLVLKSRGDSRALLANLDGRH
ncbi:AAA family ATPase [Rhizobium sp. KAs_5_22]|uniref:AAA family ATPase n=1 Tax=Ciceribacter selenitireducens TaxID=448181 RepID=UPI00048DEAE8|nr:AAA family ATPase [Ciceribacter selenitireducens]PPJ46683.1 AAA family ATPase [Rhizobium sp. KAs_5_22]